MKSYKDLKEKFDLDVKNLQERCKHKKSDWFLSRWAPGHFGGDVKLCLFCNKILENKHANLTSGFTNSTNLKNGISWY